MNKNITRSILVVSLLFLASVASAQDKLAQLVIDQQPALAFKIPTAAKVTATNGYLNIVTTNLSCYIWYVPNAKKPEDAIPRVPEIIKTEFVHFKTTSSMDMVVMGAPAKHIIGSGNEADDNDSGHAEVVLFVVGGKVFAGCVHGEADDASKARPAMMALLRTAQSPP